MNEFNNQVNGGNVQTNAQVNNNIENQINNESKKNVKLLIAIITIVVALSGGTLAYFAFSASNTAIGGEAGVVDLTLTVAKVLPDADSTVDELLVVNYSEVPTALNNSCLDSRDEFMMCQLYKITLSSSATGVGTNVKGSIKFDNETVPNLSWLLLPSDYNSGTNYTTAVLGNTFNTATGEFVNFVNSYNLLSGTSKDYYILMWVNETDGEQTDNGSFGGTIRFEDAQGKGVTSTFTAS